MTSHQAFARVLLLAACLAAGAAAAQSSVPEALQPWRDWVLHGLEFRACPVLNGTQPGGNSSHVCAWPGELALTVDSERARFAQEWELYASEWVPLPGDAEHWPAAVTVNGSPSPVVLRAGRAAVRLERGRHRIAGELVWGATRPASIPIPREGGLVSLRLDDVLVARPELDGGTLWLGLRPEAIVERDRLSVAVYRRLVDGMPILLETLIELDVAGQSRELELGGVLLAGFSARSLQAPLPAQLDQQGVLRTQVRPGRWVLRIEQHSRQPLEQIVLPEPADPWPAEEIWSFEAAPRLRVAALEGAPPADSLRSGVPGDWQHLPSYRAAAGQTLTLVERSRTDAAEANRVTLARDLWLDFEGGAFTARDRVRGRMSSRWRLDMSSPYVMTMAAVPSGNLLITQGLEAGLQGVELREPELALTTTARIEHGGAMPVTGYREIFDSVATTLHLPPAHRLMAAPGAEQAVGAWTNQWRLLDIFLVLIITSAAWRLFGPAVGIVAGVAVVLTFQEPWAPRWAWLNLLAVIALLRVVPEGRASVWLRRYRFVSVAALVLLLVPFTVLQLRVVLFPQLEHAVLQRAVMFAEAAPSRDRAATQALSRVAREAAAVDEITVTGSRQLIGDELARFLPGALVQTGPGLPDWTWHRYRLSWSGPVEADQTHRLVIFGPWPVAVWRVAGLLAALALLALLLRPGFRLPPGVLRTGSTTGAVVLVALCWPAPGQAQSAGEFPSPALLEELRNRLTEPAPCHPGCAELTHALLDLDGDALTLDLELAVQDAVAVPIPGAPRGWRPESIAVDGELVNLLYRGADGRPWLRMSPGVHRAVLRGSIPSQGNLSIPFPLAPRRVDVQAPGWDVAGVVNGQAPSGAVELIRREQQGDDATVPLESVFPPFVEVLRWITFDLDWRVETHVQRRVPAEGAFTVPVALLPGEAVITAGLEVQDERALVAFAADQQTVSWASRLPTADSLTLTSPAAAASTEAWTFTVGHIWHAEYSGLPATPSEQAGMEHFRPEYYPRPGETLSIVLTRPEPAGGDTIAIDSVDYRYDVGARAARSSLTLVYRSTRGEQHLLQLPADSELEAVRIDGQPVPLRLEDGRLGLPIAPGEHRVELTWRNAAGPAFSTPLLVVDLGAGASNLRVTLGLPADRWVLFTFGPTLGPAVLYWPELLVFALAALLLGRLALSPLRTHEWLLLGLGLSTFAWPVLLLFAGVLFAFSWRSSAQLPQSSLAFNALQLVLGAAALLALLALARAIPVGLLGEPDMHILSPVQGGALSWFTDRSLGTTPAAGAVSVSLWFYKAAMLAWALWLSFALLRWLPWGWRALTSGGGWRSRVKKAAPA